MYLARHCKAYVSPLSLLERFNPQTQRVCANLVFSVYNRRK